MSLFFVSTLPIHEGYVFIIKNMKECQSIGNFCSKIEFSSTLYRSGQVPCSHPPIMKGHLGVVASALSANMMRHLPSLSLV